jgi:hypothetical protein
MAHAMGGEQLRRHTIWIVAALALAASISGVANGFAMDDVHMIVQDPRAHSLRNALDVFSQSYWPESMGGALFRPLTSLGFILQWFVGGGSPLPFHVISLLAYVAVCIAVLRLCEELVDWRVAALGTALFAVHPLHVEVVANVVGQAELFAALMVIPALTMFIRARRKGPLGRSTMIAIALLYGAGLMFKEHVVVLPAILIAAELTVVGGGKSVAARFRAIAVLIVAMALVAAAFIVWRASVLGSVEGAGISPIFVGKGYSTRFFTMLRVIMEWIRLFFWPARLSTDYAPLVELASSFEPDMIPSVMVLSAAVFAGYHLRRTSPVATFILAFTGLTLLIPSNLIVVTGFVLAERSLFLPSIGVMLAVAMAVRFLSPQFELSEGARVGALGGLAIVLLLGAVRSSTRNPVWRDNAALIEQNVQDRPLHWYAHMQYSQLLSDRSRGAEAIREAEIAVRLGERTDYRLLAFAADMFQMHGRCELAAPYYQRSLAMAPDQPQVKINAALCAATLAKVADSRPRALAGESAPVPQ